MSSDATVNSNVVDISRRFNAPDQNCVHRDPDGTTYYKFAFDYEHEGKTWGFEIWARDRQDAIAKMASLKATTEYKRQVISEVRQ